MFERFADSAKQAFFVARLNAFRDESKFIEGHHLLHSLLVGQDPIVLALLNRTQVSADRLLSALPSSPSRAVDTGDREIPFSEELKRALAFAAAEADGLKHAKIGTGHLLLGLLREEESAGRGLLTHAGVHSEAVRTALREPV